MAWLFFFVFNSPKGPLLSLTKSFGPTPCQRFSCVRRTVGVGSPAMESIFPPLMVGSRFSGLVRAVECNAHTRVKVVAYDSEAIFMGDLELGMLHTLYFVEVVATDPWVFQPCSETQVIPIPLWKGPPQFQVKELCAGMGGMGLICKHPGGSVVAACDHPQLACSFLRRNFDHPIIEGSLTSDRVICDLQHAGSASQCIYTLGFPCQPFSAQGDLRGLEDSRCQALWGSLRCLYLHAALGVVLECVPAVRDHFGL